MHMYLVSAHALPKGDDEIERAYRAAVKKYHPDRNFNTPEATELSQQLNAARAILKLAMLRGAPPDIDVSMAGF